MQEMEKPTDRCFDLDFFNVFESGARQLLDDYPPAGRTSESRAAVHMIVVGLGHFGAAVVKEAARRFGSNRASKEQLRITLIDRAATDKAGRLQLESPALERVCEIIPRNMDIESPEFHRCEFLAMSDLSSVYVCTDDDSVAFAAALVLHRHLRDRKVPVAVRMSQGGGLASLLRDDDADQDFESLHVFSLLDRTCTRQLVLGGTTEAIARALHEDYVRVKRKIGETVETNPSTLPWPELREALRESNREQARHLGVKLHAVGCELGPLSGFDETPMPFSPGEIERLAELEHGRWMEARERDGWRYGPDEDLGKKRSRYLVPWQGLPENIKANNRSFIERLPEVLAPIGLEIVRLR
jgi:hypothetical protein